MPRQNDKVIREIIGILGMEAGFHRDAQEYFSSLSSSELLGLYDQVQRATARMKELANKPMNAPLTFHSNSLLQPQKRDDVN